jgi:N-hydroxyarylamine O-acetyltransferase
MRDVKRSGTPRALSGWARRYLALLGISPEPPSISALSQITEQHLKRIPFENVTTVLRFRDFGSSPPAPDPEWLLEQWEMQRGGGLCYEISRTLRRLLEELGYRCFSISGTITFPGSHEALLVEVEGGRYLVDVGNGAPFFYPVPIGEVVEVRHAGLKYRFRPGPEERALIQDRWVDGQWRPFCIYDLEPKSDAELHSGYLGHHTPGRGKFLGELVLVRCDHTEVYRLRNHKLMRFSEAGTSLKTVATRDDYLRVAREIFRLPRLPILEAIRVLRDLGVRFMEEGQ